MVNPILDSLKSQLEQLVEREKALRVEYWQTVKAKENVARAIESLESTNNLFSTPSGGSLPMPNLTGSAQVGSGDTKTKKKRAKNPKKELVAMLVKDILREHGRPMSRAELFKAIKDRGVDLQGENPEMVLSTMLWRIADEYGIAHKRGRGYGLKGRDDLTGAFS